MTHTERFAPSPTGPLHLGHAFSALTAHQAAMRAKGRFLLRIEDIDASRARAEWENAIYDDLKWLGIRWETPVLRQSERKHIYAEALARLWEKGLLYPCTCNRRDILSAASAPQEGGDPLIGPDGVVYPGTCRNKPHTGAAMPMAHNLRLDMTRAIDCLGVKTIDYVEIGSVPGAKSTRAGSLVDTVGDVVLARKDMGTSYHLSVVIDDAAQKISHVTRGEDLSDATFLHVFLQRLLGLPTPIYNHHRLIRDENGKRLAKRDDAKAIRLYRDQGAAPQDILAMIGLHS